MFPEQQAIADWIKAELFSEDGYFAPERVGPNTLLYSTATKSLLMNYLIDGYQPAAPTWRCRPGELPSHALFRHLADFISESPASWYHINDDDDAYSRLEWVWPARISEHWHYSLWMMQGKPADQSGLCRQGLVAHDRSFFVEFRFQPGHHFELHFFGTSERLSRLRRVLDTE